jgi:hypothetical protein
VTNVATEDKLLTPCSSYGTLEQIEACLTGESLTINPGLIWIEIFRPAGPGLKMTERMTKPT